MSEGLCIYCGARPQFWSVRCVICRQRFATNPLPYGARRALRLYREAESEREREQIEVEARYAVRKLLASGDLNGDSAKALGLYAGVDTGKWRTYSEVGRLMKISKEWVRQLLLPSKVCLAGILGHRVPWKLMQEDFESNAKVPYREPDPIRCCDNPIVRTIESESHYYENLPEVILNGLSVHRCENCQTEFTIIPRQEELDRELARVILLKPASLAGRELRFLRRASRLTIETLAGLLAVTSSTLIAWEACAAIRYTHDLATRVVIASVVDRATDPRLILNILGSIRIGKKELDPLYARWSDAEARWIIEASAE